MTTVVRFCTYLVVLSPFGSAGLLAGQTVGYLDVHVVDPLGTPVPGAAVTLTGRVASQRHVAIASDDGRATLTLLAGEYLVEVDAERFARPPVTSVRIVAGERQALSIRIEIRGFSDLVIVTAAGTAQAGTDMSKAADVVARTDMDARGDRSIADAMRSVAGLSVSALGGPGASTSINIRGLRSEDTAVLVDGVRLRDAGATQGDAGTFLSDLLLTAPDRIEVLRGAGSSLYGSQAIGGAINIITRSGAGRPSGSTQAHAGGLGSSLGRADLSGSTRTGRLSYSAGIARLAVADGVDGDDRADNTSGQGEGAVTIRHNTRLSARIFGARASTMLNEAPGALSGLPPSGIVDARPLSLSALKRYQDGAPLSSLDIGTATFIPSANDPDNRRVARFTSALLQVSHQVGSRATARVFLHDVSTSRRFDEGPRGISAFEPSDDTWALYDGRIHTLGARADVQAGSRHLLTVGYEFERERYSSEAPQDPRSPASTVDAVQRSHTAFIQDQIAATARLQVSGALRVQQFSLSPPRLEPLEQSPFRGALPDAPPVAVTADVSAVFAPRPDTRVRTHLGTGYRAPSLFERFGTSFGRFGYTTYGDPRLGPERALTFDLGIEHDLASSLRASATWFNAWLDDVIVFDFSGAIDPATDPFGRSAGYRTGTGASTRGIEVQVLANPSTGTRLEAVYTLVDTDAEAIPRHLASVAVSQQISSRLQLHLNGLVAGSHRSTLSDPITFATRVFRFAGARQLNAAAVYTHPIKGRLAVRLSGRVDNLFGSTHHASGYRTPGRYAMGGVGVVF